MSESRMQRTEVATMLPTKIEGVQRLVGKVGGRLELTAGDYLQLRKLESGSFILERLDLLGPRRIDTTPQSLLSFVDCPDLDHDQDQTERESATETHARATTRQPSRKATATRQRGG